MLLICFSSIGNSRGSRRDTLSRGSREYTSSRRAQVTYEEMPSQTTWKGRAFATTYPTCLPACLAALLWSSDFCHKLVDGQQQALTASHSDQNENDPAKHTVRLLHGDLQVPVYQEDVQPLAFIPQDPQPKRGRNVPVSSHTMRGSSTARLLLPSSPRQLLLAGVSSALSSLPISNLSISIAKMPLPRVLHSSTVSLQVNSLPVIACTVGPAAPQRQVKYSPPPSAEL